MRLTRRKTLRVGGSTAFLSVAGCVGAGGPGGEAIWSGVNAALVDSPPEDAPIIAEQNPRVSDLAHVMQAINSAIENGQSEVEITEAEYQRTRDVFLELPNLLVVGDSINNEAPQFTTPEDSILLDFLRGQDLNPVISVRSGESLVAVWLVQYELE